MTTKSTKTIRQLTKIHEIIQVAPSTRSPTNTPRSTPSTSATLIYQACSHVWRTTGATESMSNTLQPVTSSRSTQGSHLDSTHRSREPSIIGHRNRPKLFLKNCLLPMVKFTRRSRRRRFSLVRQRAASPTCCCQAFPRRTSDRPNRS